MVTVVDERCGDAWIAAVQNDDQLRPETDELARDIIGFRRKNTALPIDAMVERKLPDGSVQECDCLVRRFGLDREHTFGVFEPAQYRYRLVVAIGKDQLRAQEGDGRQRPFLPDLAEVA